MFRLLQSASSGGVQQGQQVHSGVTLLDNLEQGRVIGSSRYDITSKDGIGPPQHIMQAGGRGVQVRVYGLKSPSFACKPLAHRAPCG